MSDSESVPLSKEVDRVWMTVKQACDYTGIGRTKFDELKDRGVLKGAYIEDGRLLRFHREELDQALLKRLGGN